MLVTAAAATRPSTRPRRSTPPRAVSSTAASTRRSRSRVRAPPGPEKSPKSSTAGPTAMQSVEVTPAVRPAAASIAAVSRTVVVLPLVPVTSATGTSCTAGQSTAAGGGSSARPGRREGGGVRLVLAASSAAHRADSRLPAPFHDLGGGIERVDRRAREEAGAGGEAPHRELLVPPPQGIEHPAGLAPPLADLRLHLRLHAAEAGVEDGARAA